ncbi:MAG: hypothetical protein FJ290_33495, partial [Planctomycetes bacterium]|nr:hypothetical protein [Planctomycetota bacterium]
MEASGIPEPKPRSGFLKRHRGTLVTLGIVLYTAALGVAVCDDVFHLGLFPTTYEREARSLIAAFESADEGARREAADRLCREADAFIAIPELIRALGN